MEVLEQSLELARSFWSVRWVDIQPLFVGCDGREEDETKRMDGSRFELIFLGTTFFPRFFAVSRPFAWNPTMNVTRMGVCVCGP